MKKILIFDCDNTLSQLEGIDELGRALDDKTFLQIAQLTNDAMNGKLSLNTVFARRMKLISPNIKDIQNIAQMYIENIEPTAKSTLAALQKQGWTLIIVSGGFMPLIQPLADLLNIKEVHAVPIYFDNEGNYTGYDTNYPTTRNKGKIEVINEIKSHHHPQKILMVGDGISDLATKSVVDQFICFNGFITRNRVVAEADKVISKLDELLEFI